MTPAGRPSGRPALASLGIDVGGSKVLAVGLDAGGAVVGEARVATPMALRQPRALMTDEWSGGPGETLAGVLDEVLGPLLAAAGPAPRSGVPIGVGLPGMVADDGVLAFSPHLPGATGLDCSQVLGRRFPAVVVDNDANCAAAAEHALGAGVGCRHFLLVTLGTGIGGGLVIAGEILRGAHGYAGEIGHMVVDPAGPACPCGSRGCWERLASGGGLGRFAREAAAAGKLRQVVAMAGGDPEGVRGEHVAGAARAGDAEALAVVAELGRWVAVGLSNLVAVLDPERIVLGGGLAEMGDLLLDPVRRAFAGLVEGVDARPPIEIVTARFGERAGAIGAALLARRALGVAAGDRA